MKKIRVSRDAPTSASAPIALVTQAIGWTYFVKEISPQNQDSLLPKCKTVFQSRANKGFSVGSLGKNNYLKGKKSLISR